MGRISASVAHCFGCPTGPSVWNDWVVSPFGFLPSFRKTFIYTVAGRQSRVECCLTEWLQEGEGSVRGLCPLLWRQTAEFAVSCSDLISHRA
eukprot:3555738-Amphidinium_carterae.1